MRESAHDTFADLLTRLHAGHSSAARELHEQYVHRLVGLAQQRLGSVARRKTSAEDVAQSVFKSFFARLGTSEWQFPSRDNLWALLAEITIRKCHRQSRYHHALRRDTRREATLAKESADESWQVPGSEPPPEQAVLLSEMVQVLLEGLPERERAIVSLRLSGCSVQEIVQETGIATRTIERRLVDMRARLERHLDDDAEDTSNN